MVIIRGAREALVILLDKQILHKWVHHNKIEDKLDFDTSDSCNSNVNLMFEWLEDFEKM